MWRHGTRPRRPPHPGRTPGSALGTDAKAPAVACWSPGRGRGRTARRPGSRNPRDEASPVYGLPPQARFKLHDAGRAIGAITAFRQQHERILELIAEIGEDLGAPPGPYPAEELTETNARVQARLDQLEALRGELADLLVDAPAFVGDRPLYTDRVAPELDELPVVAGGGRSGTFRSSFGPSTC